MAEGGFPDRVTNWTVDRAFAELVKAGLLSDPDSLPHDHASSAREQMIEAFLSAHPDSDIPELIDNLPGGSQNGRQAEA